MHGQARPRPRHGNRRAGYGGAGPPGEHAGERRLCGVELLTHVARAAGRPARKGRS